MTEPLLHSVVTNTRLGRRPEEDVYSSTCLTCGWASKKFPASRGIDLQWESAIAAADKHIEDTKQ